MALQSFQLSDQVIFLSTLTLLAAALIAYRAYMHADLFENDVAARRKRRSIVAPQHNRKYFFHSLQSLLTYWEKAYELRPFGARLYEASVILSVVFPFGLIFVVWLLTGVNVSVVEAAFENRVSGTMRFFCFLTLYAAVAAAILSSSIRGWAGVAFFSFAVFPLAIFASFFIQRTGIGAFIGAAVLAVAMGALFLGWRVLLFGAPLLAYTVVDAVARAFEDATLPLDFKLTGYVVMVLVAFSGGLIQRLLDAFETERSPDYVRNAFWFVFTGMLIVGAIAVSYLAKEDKRDDLFHVIVIYFAVIPFATALLFWLSASCAMLAGDKSARVASFSKRHVVLVSAACVLAVGHCVLMTAIFQTMNNLSAARGLGVWLELGTTFQALRTNSVPQFTYWVLALISLSLVPPVILYSAAAYEKYAFRPLPIAARLFIDKSLRARSRLKPLDRVKVVTLLLVCDIFFAVLVAAAGWSLWHVVKKLGIAARAALALSENAARILGANVLVGPVF